MFRLNLGESSAVGTGYTVKLKKDVAPVALDAAGGRAQPAPDEPEGTRRARGRVPRKCRELGGAVARSAVLKWMIGIMPLLSPPIPQRASSSRHSSCENSLAIKCPRKP